MRRSQLQLHTGSGRAITNRAFSLAMPQVKMPPPPQAATQTPKQPAYATPCAASMPPSTRSLTAHASRNSRASVGSAMEGVPERPWRSIAKTPAMSRLTASTSIFQYTPVEGVPERIEWQAPKQQSIKRQSTAGRLRTPSTAQKHAQQASPPASTSRPHAVLQLQHSPGTKRTSAVYACDMRFVESVVAWRNAKSCRACL